MKNDDSTPPPSAATREALDRIALRDEVRISYARFDELLRAEERLSATESAPQQVNIGPMFQPAGDNDPPDLRLNGVEYNVQLRRVADTHVELSDGGDAWHDLWMSGAFDAHEKPEWFGRFDEVARSLGLEFDRDRKVIFARVEMPDTPTPSEAQFQACLDASEAVCQALLVVDGWRFVLPKLADVRASNRRLNRRCQEYEAALAQKKRDGGPDGSRSLTGAMLRAEVTRLEAEVERLRTEADDRAHDAHQAAFDEVCAERSRWRDEAERLRGQLDTEATINGTMSRKVEQMRNAEVVQAQRIAGLEAQVERLRAEHEAAVDEVVRLARSGEQARQEVERLRAGAGVCATNRRPCDENQRALVAAQRRIEDLTREVHALESEVSRLRDAGAVNREPTEGDARTGESADESGPSASIANETGGER